MVALIYLFGCQGIGAVLEEGADVYAFFFPQCRKCRKAADSKMEKSALPKPLQKEEKPALLHPAEMRREIQY